MQEDVTAVLQGVLEPDANVRQRAEALLENGSKQPGFGMALLSAALTPTNSTDIRQLAGVLLKKHIKEHWTPESSHYVEPIISDEEKAAIKASLPSGLSDATSSIRTAIAMAIASVAQWDCPQNWPELVPGLVQAIGQKGNLELVDGAVTCFGMFIDELSEDQVMAVAPIMLPEMLNIAGGASDRPVELRERAIGIFKSIIDVFEMLAKERKTEVQNLLSPALGPWMQLFATIIGSPTTVETRQTWGLKLACLAALVRLVPSFGKWAAPHLPPVMAASWQMFVNGLPLYTEMEVKRNSEEEGDDDDPDGTSLAALVSELFEFVLTLVANPKFRAAVTGSLPEMLYITVGYMQMTGAQTENWAEDANALLTENDNDFTTVRASCEMLVDEVLDALPKAGKEALATAFHRRLQESSEAQCAGDPNWWKLHEAVISLLGAVADRLPRKPPSNIPETASSSSGGTNTNASIDITSFVAPLLQQDLSTGLQGGQTSPFIVGRALWLASKVVHRLPDDVKLTALQTAVAALSPGSSAPVQVGGCQAAGTLCAEVPAEAVKALSEPLFIGLTTLLGDSEEDMLHLALDGLVAVCKADPEGTTRWEPHITPPVLKVWVDNVNDPLLAEDAEALLRSMAKVPTILPAMQARMVPTIAGVLTSPASHPAILVSGCLDLANGLLSNCKDVADIAAVSNALTGPAMALLASTDDDDVAAASTAYLRTLVQIGKQEALGPDPAGAIQGLTQAALHILRTDSNIPDRAARNGGTFVREMLRSFGPLLGSEQTSQLLRASALRLGTAEEPALVQGLISCLAFAVTLDSRGFVDCLAAQGGQPLIVGLRRWTERQVEVRSGYDIRLTTTALGTLLTLDHPALDALTVKGKRIDQGGAIRTRSKAVTQEERWSEVPFRVKVITLLVDAYIESSVQSNGMEQVDDEGEWEEDEEDDSSDGDDDGEERIGEAVPYFGVESLDGFDDGDDGYDLELAFLDPLEAERRKGDPLLEMDVGGYAAGVLKSFAAAAPEIMQSVAGELTPTQLEAAKKIVG